MQARKPSNEKRDSFELLKLKLEQSEHRFRLLLALMMAVSCAAGAVTTVPTILAFFSAHVAAIFSTPWATAALGVVGATFGSVTAQLRRP